MVEQANQIEPGQSPKPLTREQLDQAASFFQERLIGQPEVVQVLTNILYKQNALLKRALEHKERGQQVALPADPTVVLLMGGSWGKSLAAKLIPMALSGTGYGPLTELTPLPQDPEGTLYMEPAMLTVPFATVLVENIEVAYGMNTRFVSNLAHLIGSGLIPMIDEQAGNVRPIPLGLTTFMLTTDIADEEIRQTLSREGRLGFLHPDVSLSPEDAYQEIQRICRRALSQLPAEILREVDETVILRPLGQDDLRQVFDLEIGDYQRAIFPGRILQLAFTPDARAHLFDEAQQGLEVYSVHALRRVLQRHIDPVVYRAYNEGELSEDALEGIRVSVSLEGEALSVRLEPSDKS